MLFINTCGYCWFPELLPHSLSEDSPPPSHKFLTFTRGYAKKSGIYMPSHAEIGFNELQNLTSSQVL